MLKLIALASVWLAILGSYGVVYKIGGDNRETQINAKQYKADNEILMAQSRTMVNAFKQTQDGLKGLAAVNDTSENPPSIRSAVEYVCSNRKANGLPCATPRPSRKPEG